MQIWDQYSYLFYFLRVLGYFCLVVIGGGGGGGIGIGVGEDGAIGCDFFFLLTDQILIEVFWWFLLVGILSLQMVVVVSVIHNDLLI